MYKIAYIDDQQHSIHSFKQVVDQLPQKIDLTTFRNPLDFLKSLEDGLHCDVAFIDVEMPQMSGLDLARKLAEVGILVVFVTNYPEYAFRAFDVFTIDYLIKPITAATLTRSLKRCDVVMRGKTILPKEEIVKKLNDVQEYIDDSKGKFPLKNGRSYQFIDVNKLMLVRSTPTDGCEFVMTDGNVLSSNQRLKKIEEQFLDLEMSQMYRCGRSEIINLKLIKSITREEGDYMVSFINGDVIELLPYRVNMMLDKMKTLS